MYNNFKRLGLFFLLVVIAGCGGDSPDSDKTATPNIVINLPAEYSTGQTGGGVPDYVTGIYLTVTGTDMDPINITIDRNTLSASVTVSYGIRTFSVTITTSIGRTFSGSKTVEVSSGSGGSIEINLNVNAPPTVTLSASSTNPAIDQTITLTATATDGDGDVLTYRWSGGGELSPSDNTAKWFSTVSGTFKVSVEVDDGQGGLASASVTINVDNNPPTISSFTANTITPKTDEVIDLSVVATDLDGDLLTYAWSATGGAIADTGSTATWFSPTKGAYTITVTVTDTNGGSATATLTIDVANNPPTISSFTATSVTPMKNDLVDLTVVATDLDGDTLTYAWSATGGTITGAGAAATWSSSVAGAFDVTVTVTDGVGGTATSTLTMNVSNNPPVITSLTTPDITPQTGQTITLTVVATDLDGDTLTYAWGATGGTIVGAGTTATWSSTVAGTFTATVIVTDTSGGTATSSITLSPWAPLAAPALAASPGELTNNLYSEKITASWNAIGGAASYKLYYATAPGVTTADTALNLTGVKYIHPCAIGVTTYFMIQAFDVNGNPGITSNEASALCPGPSPPVINSVISKGGSVIAVNWTVSASSTMVTMSWGTTNCAGTTTGYYWTNVASTSPNNFSCITGICYFFYIQDNAGGYRSAFSNTSATVQCK